ncbi:MAG TPA: helix-turn-helix domain-containing protein [Ktedonobacterales bacterium]|jgi:hypothetical protein|nr:helix-turn-helix domain-containing protein [Ktedonobacterales bacterium]
MRIDEPDELVEAEDEGGDLGQGRAPVIAQDERARLAVTRYLQGWRVAEVADSLAVSETTARRWIRRTLATLAEDERTAQATQLQRAIEGQRAVASAAWEAYERERQLDEALLRGELDSVRRRAIRGPRRASTAHGGAKGDASGGDDGDCPPIAIEEYQRPKRSTQGARYLALALAAQREVARLQGLYARLEQPERAVSITISRRPDGPENAAPQWEEEAQGDERDGR